MIVLLCCLHQALTGDVEGKKGSGLYQHFRMHYSYNKDSNNFSQSLLKCYFTYNYWMFQKVFFLEDNFSPILMN